MAQAPPNPLTQLGQMLTGTMKPAQNLLLRCAGLYTFPQHLAMVPEGALLRALNIIINRDGVAESRRGFKLFGTSTGGGTSNVVHQLMIYKNRLLRHFGTGAGTTLEYDSDGSGTFSGFSGTYAEVEQGLRIKSLEANSNFYFTTSNGIKKISSATASGLASASVVNSGGAKALDLKSALHNSSGFFTQDSTTAYRIVWGYKDANQNVILGTPSARSVVYNSLLDLEIGDFNALLTTLDGENHTQGINDGNYHTTLVVSTSASAATLRANLLALAAKLDADVVITNSNATTFHQRVSATQGKVTFTSSVATLLQIGDKVNFTGLGIAEMNNNAGTITNVAGTVITFAPTVNYVANDGAPVGDAGGVCTRIKYTAITSPGTVSTPATTTQLEALQTYYSTIVSDLQNELSGIATGANFNGSNARTSQTVDLTFTIPHQVDTSWFYQIYRTPLTSSTGAVVLNNLDPGDECQLADEDNPSATDISNGYISFHDVTPESFLGAYLYTNPNTGDGIAQANEVPPLAKDMVTFKGYTFYSNTQTKQRLNSALLSVLNLVADTSTITITDGSTSTTYTFSASEDIANKKILISTAATPAQQVDETARSLERVINRNASDIVYAYYLSGPDDVPGLLLFEARNLGQNKFYITSNSQATSDEFNPSLGTITAITAISLANPTHITCVGHGLSTNDVVVISGSNSTPTVDGPRTITKIDADHFTVPVNVTVAGNRGGWQLLSNIPGSDNEVAPNRIYYSKIQQPEAVPLLNYVEVGPKDKEVLRVIALRDNLFVLKEEAVYRLSGLVAPFTVSLFDSSTEIKAPDSAVVLNNLIYCYTSQGIATISDTGVSIISRPIEDKLIKLASSEYTNFSTATFGMSYESDRSYYLWTVTNTADSVATQHFRYNTFTNSWVESNKSATCGIVNASDDKAYIGPTDINYIEQERKMFDRTDYADREISTTINHGSISGTSIILPSVTNVKVGDVLVQTQYLTVNKFNQLLTKLDADTVLSDSNYYSTLKASAGTILSTSMDNVITKIANDAGRIAALGSTAGATYTALSPCSANFASTQTTFNSLVTLLNNDTGTGYHNYLSSSGTVLQETVIETVNTSTNTIITQYAFPFIDGPALVYNHISCILEWMPQTFQDVSMTKHVSEGTVIFEDLSFSDATVSFASDLSPEFEDISFTGNGNGAYGLGIYGNGPYGGNGSGVPFRTYIPREKQRCRYLIPKFTHSVAREIYSLYGISLTWLPTGSRGWR
jgi:hypothetical protein